MKLPSCANSTSLRWALAGSAPASAAAPTPAEVCSSLRRCLSMGSSFIAGALRPAIDFAAALHELDGLGFHALRQRFLLRNALRLGILPHVLRDLHRAEVRAAHRAEVRQLGTFLRQRLVVELARLVGIEPEVELVLPAELEACLR